MHDSVKAIFPLSAPDTLFDKSALLERGDLPAALFVYAQFDEPYVLSIAPGLFEMMQEAGVDTEFAWVPGMPHFYPNGAPSLGSDGTRISLGDRIIAFLDRNLKD